MTTQIFGTNKCRSTQKAIRFFKERGADYQFIDINTKAPSPRELEDMITRAGADALLDTDSKTYKKRGMAYMDFDPAEEIAENPELLKTPVVRNRRSLCVGEDEDCWAQSLET